MDNLDTIHIPDRSRALVGFRVWRLRTINPLYGPASVHLCPYSLSYYNEKKEDNKGTWDQETYTAEAGCYRRRWYTKHGVRLPAESCKCGLHGFATLDGVMDYVEKSPPRPPLIAGIVAVEGKVLRKSLGFRAEKATLLALFDPNRVHSWHLSRESNETYEHFFGIPFPLGKNGATYNYESYEDWHAPYVMPPKLKDVPLYLDGEPFRNPGFAREWARVRNCELYADSIEGEPLKDSKNTSANPWLRDDGAM